MDILDQDAPTSAVAEETYEFSNDWFEGAVAIWDHVVPAFDPSKILEIGSYEGRSTCYMLEKLSVGHAVEIYCVDTWLGGIEHDKSIMSDVQRRFDKNIALALKMAKNHSKIVKCPGHSQLVLPHLLAAGHAGSFDLIYVDGSHQAPDVLADAVMSFYLLKVGGLIIFDDYTWYTERHGMEDLLNMPKLAIDAFMNIFIRKLRVLRELPLYQVFAQKTST